MTITNPKYHSRVITRCVPKYVSGKREHTMETVSSVTFPPKKDSNIKFLSLILDQPLPFLEIKFYFMTDFFPLSSYVIF